MLVLCEHRTLCAVRIAEHTPFYHHVLCDVYESKRYQHYGVTGESVDTDAYKLHIKRVGYTYRYVFEVVSLVSTFLYTDIVNK